MWAMELLWMDALLIRFSDAASEHFFKLLAIGL